MNTRLLTAAAAASVIVMVAGCGDSSGDQSASSTSTSSTTSTTTSSTTSSAPETSAPSTTSSTAEPTSSNPTTSTTSSAPASTSSAPNGPATKTILVNAIGPDGKVSPDFTVKKISESPCGSPVMGIDASGFAKGKGVFSCSPNASGTYACWTFKASGTVGCIQDPSKNVLTVFTSTMSYSGPPTADPMPLRTKLADGTVCSAVMHDQGQHWQGRQGWLECTDGRMLLTVSEGNRNYFNTAKDTWTAEAVPQKGIVKPVKVAVASVTYAEGA